MRKKSVKILRKENNLMFVKVGKVKAWTTKKGLKISTKPKKTKKS